ncbi:hypothetical protein LguiA_004307 [Lonicera macranthoides]
MGSIGNKPRLFGTHNPPCTRSHQILSLALVIVTFFLTRLFDQFTSSSSCTNYSSPSHVQFRSGDGVVRFNGGEWPLRGYGPHLSVKIYVYAENEIDGLKQLLYGREGKISADSCLKGQWGTQTIFPSDVIGQFLFGDEVVWISSFLRSAQRQGAPVAEAALPAFQEFEEVSDLSIVNEAVLPCRQLVKIHRLLLQSRFRTRKKEEADLFFVPSYVKCVRMMGGLNDKEINQTYVKVLSQMPYFRLSGGRDHIFVFPSGAGAHLFKSWSKYLNRSIILTPEGDRTDKRDTSAFNTWKDIIIPGNVDDGMTGNGARLVEPLPLSRRKHLANFLGRAQGKIGRFQLIELAKKFPDKECVPVILSDQAELPFQNVVDYAQISIKWPSTEIGPQLLDYLESIPDKEIEEMIERGRQIRCLWVYAPEAEPCSAFRGIMWELQRKVRQFHQSAETFWLHNGSIVNRNLVEFNSWKPPMPLP